MLCLCHDWEKRLRREYGNCGFEGISESSTKYCFNVECGRCFFPYCSKIRTKSVLCESAVCATATNCRTSLHPSNAQMVKTNLVIDWNWRIVWVSKHSSKMGRSAVSTCHYRGVIRIRQTSIGVDPQIKDGWDELRETICDLHSPPVIDSRNTEIA